MLAGGAEAAICPLSIASFARMKALSRRNDAPEIASRPFDADRDGFVMGEGAGLMVLEEYEHAKQRGAKIYAELIGYGLSGDAYHITSPGPEGEGLARAIRGAIVSAGLNPEDVDYINAHGTSTQANDTLESQAIQSVLGSAAETVAISSTKGVTGHCLGAAGGIEAVYSVLAICEGRRPTHRKSDHARSDMPAGLYTCQLTRASDRGGAEQLVRVRWAKRMPGLQENQLVTTRFHHDAQPKSYDSKSNAKASNERFARATRPDRPAARLKIRPSDENALSEPSGGGQLAPEYRSMAIRAGRQDVPRIGISAAFLGRCLLAGQVEARVRQPGTLSSMVARNPSGPRSGRRG